MGAKHSRRPILDSLIVHLAVGGPANGVYKHQIARRLIACQRCAYVRAELGQGWSGEAVGLDDSADALAKSRVWQTNHDGVTHHRIGLERFFDLLREDLLAAGVDADRAASQKLQSSVQIGRASCRE